MSPDALGPIRISAPPRTRKEIYALERACLRGAKARGHRGRFARLEAERLYNAAVEEASRTVREPLPQHAVVKPPPAAIPTPPAPAGMKQTDSGLYVPETPAA